MKESYLRDRALSIGQYDIFSTPKMKSLVEGIKKYLVDHGFQRVVVGMYADRLTESLSTRLLVQRAIDLINGAEEEPKCSVYAVGLSFSKAEFKTADVTPCCQLNLSLAMEKAQLAVEMCVRLNEIRTDESRMDKALWGMQSRMGMVGLYHFAGLVKALVAGTAHLSELSDGRCSKYGHDAADLMPLACLRRSEVEVVAKAAGLSDEPQEVRVAPASAARGGLLPLTCSRLFSEKASEIIKEPGYAHLAIRRTLQVQVDITKENMDTEIKRRVSLLKEYMQTNGIKNLVLGVSGGVDSTATGLLAQRAIHELNADNLGQYALYAIRLPYKTQKDEEEAQEALDSIAPAYQLNVDISPVVDAISTSIQQAASAVLDLDKALSDRAYAGFCAGNTKARVRMVVQYFLAELLGNAKVIGTDQASEALMGFFTKYGDGAADVMPISGLTKQQVKLMAEHLGASPKLVNKTPTADLEDDKPMLPDEEAFPPGVNYSVIEAFLTCDKQYAGLSQEIYEAILNAHFGIQHKHKEPFGMRETMYSSFEGRIFSKSAPMTRDLSLEPKRR